jgi:hypothetical protein
MVAAQLAELRCVVDGSAPPWIRAAPSQYPGEHVLFLAKQVKTPGDTAMPARKMLLCKGTHQ